MVTELEWDVREYQFLLKECQWAVETVAEVDLTSTSLQRQDSQITQSKLAGIRCRRVSCSRDSEEAKTGSLTCNGFHGQP